ncbi:WG repeat-containing protein [Prevotella melaninogenica]|uniref:WG repeat-containing protein n=1 Tax=Prevotella melaninogenica TaxID=28132 RepID=UPI0028EA3530|nr:WG repeat-containing protein [Prevotella melaninogenica]
MRKYLLLILVLVFISLLSSCQKEESVAEYIPFRSEKDGKWGFINLDGDVLLEDEFKSEPTIVSNDRFFAKNKAGYWEMYITDKKARQIGKEYVQAGAFIEDVAPVVEKGRAIDFIDKNGKVKFTLGNVDGVAITSCRNFIDGVAIFKCGGYYGAIDASGNVVIKPDYLALEPAKDGKLVGIHSKYKETEDRAKVKITVLDTSGKVLSEFALDRILESLDYFSDGVLAVAKKDTDGNNYWGLINDKGEWVLHASHKIRAIKGMRNGKFIFSDGEECGLMDFNGEVLIRPKYSDIKFTGANQLFVLDDHIDPQWKLITEEEDVISPNEFDEVYPLPGDKYFVKDDGDSWIIVDDKGKEVKTKVDIYEFSYNQGDTEFESQYLDLTSFINELHIKKDGLLGLNLTMEVADVIKSFSFLYKQYGEGDFSKNASSYRYSNDISVDLNFNNVKFQIAALFDDNVTDYTFSSGFSNISPNQISVTFYNEKQLKGHLSQLTRSLKAKLKRVGTIVKETEYALIVASGNAYYLVGSDGDKVYLNYGNLDVNAINLNMFTNSDDADHK